MPNSRRIAIVTGAGRGIGRGIALALAGYGWSITVNFRNNKEAAAETAQLIEESGGQSLVVQADVGEREGREKLVRATLNHYGAINLLVNNAGIGPAVRLNVLEVGEDSYDEVMKVNLKGPFFLSQQVATEMINLRRKRDNDLYAIVNIGSISAYTSSPSRGEYCLSKAGVGMMTALFADQLAPHGINVYEIRPGIIETDLTSVVKDKYDKLINDGLTPIKRWGQPEDVGRAVAAVAEGFLPFSTGEVINVDGGFHLRRL